MVQNLTSAIYRQPTNSFGLVCLLAFSTSRLPPKNASHLRHFVPKRLHSFQPLIYQAPTLTDSGWKTLGAAT